MIEHMNPQHQSEHNADVLHKAAMLARRRQFTRRRCKFAKWGIRATAQFLEERRFRFVNSTQMNTFERMHNVDKDGIELKYR